MMRSRSNSLYRPFAAAVVRGVHGPNVRSYLRNRALRILPAYWVILLVTGVALGAALLRDASSVLVVGWLADQPLTLLENVALAQSYDPWTLLTGVGPAWSLIEVAFYVMLPLVAALAALLARRAATRRRRRLIALLPPAALLVVGLLGKMAAHLVQVRSGMGDGWGLTGIRCWLVASWPTPICSRSGWRWASCTRKCRTVW
jgi:peptidoglycan/LPS O-acetylase OafA/YrhL